MHGPEFSLPVTYKDNELEFPSTLLLFGTSKKILVDVYGQEVRFEPDEEGCYRAIVQYEKLDEYKPIDPELLRAMAESIDKVFLG